MTESSLSHKKNSLKTNLILSSIPTPTYATGNSLELVVRLKKWRGGSGEEKSNFHSELPDCQLACDFQSLSAEIAFHGSQVLVPLNLCLFWGAGLISTATSVSICTFHVCFIWVQRVPKWKSWNVFLYVPSCDVRCCLPAVGSIPGMLPEQILFLADQLCVRLGNHGKDYILYSINKVIVHCL